MADEDITQAYINQINAGINSAFSTIQSQLVSQALSQTLPLIGDKLDDAVNTAQNGLKYIDTIKTQVTTVLANIVQSATTTAAAVQTQINNALSPYGLQVVATKNGDLVTLDFQSTTAQGHTIAYTQDLATDLGVGPLGVHVDGEASASLNYWMHLGVGYDSAGGFYVDTAANNEIVVTAQASAPDFSGSAQMGFLNFNAEDNGSSLSAQFTVNLTDGDGKLHLNEMGNAFLSATASATADISVDLNANMGSEWFPSIDAQLNVDWTASGTASSSGFLTGGAKPTVSIDNVTIDLGTFVEDFIKPTLEKLSPILEPLNVALAVLNSDIKALKVVPGWSAIFDKTGQVVNGSDVPDGKITLLDFLKMADSDMDLAPILNAMATVDKIIDWVEFFTTHSFGPDSYELGDFAITDDLRDAAFVLENVAPQVTEGAETLIAALNGLSGGGYDTIDPVTNETGQAVITSIVTGPDFAFPILSDPMAIFGLLTGKTVDLMTFELPHVELGLENQELARFDVYPGVAIKLVGALELILDFSGGFDSRGLSQFIDTLIDTGQTDYAAIFNGFYLSDYDSSNDERPEITFSAAFDIIGAFDAQIFEVGGGGGISGEIFFDLNDALHSSGAPAGRIYLDKLVDALAANPFSIFTTSGRITAGLTAYAELLNVEVWRYNSPRITLGSFSFDNNPVLPGQNPAVLPGLGDLSGDTLLVNIGLRAGERDIADNLDDGESVEIGLAAGKITIAAFGEQQSFSDVTLIEAHGNASDDQIVVSEAVIVAVNASGGAGDDLILGGGGNDTLAGDGNRDYLEGGAGDDELWGGSEDDILVGGDGGDDLHGGDGRDTASYFAATEGVLINLLTTATSGDEAAGDTFDSIEIIEGSSHADTMVGGAASVTFVGLSGNDSFTGGSQNDVLVGNEGNDSLDGGTGADILVGGKGDDVYTVDSSADQVHENRLNELATPSEGGHDTVYSSVDIDLQVTATDGGGKTIHDLRDIEDLFLTGTARVGTGNALDNKITGTSGQDTLDGVGGNDSLIGGLDNDVLRGGAGTDTLQGDAGADELFGDADSDTLYGGLGNDTLDGGGAADNMEGGADNDIYIVDHAADVIIEAGGAGNDTLKASTNYELASGVSIEVIETTNAAGTGAIELRGNDVAQVVRGNAGANVLEGLGGADSIEGGTGIDKVTYRSSAFGVSIDLTLSTQVGNDAQGDTYSSIEIHEGSGWGDTLKGNASANHLRGLGDADLLYGYAEADSLAGGAGSDTIDGGTGADTMVGGADNDTYYVDSLSDVVDEVSDDGDGAHDLIYASLNYSIASNSAVEDLTITGSANYAQGNGNANIIISTNHADTIDGGGGGDLMAGKQGDDTYHIDSMSDEIIESADEGTDLIKLQVSTLVAATIPTPDPIANFVMNTWASNVEHLDMDVESSTWRINVTGNALDNRITANQRENVIHALDGNDTVIAGGGQDSIYGGNGNDRAEFVWDGQANLDLFDGGADTDILVMDWSAATSAINKYGDAYENKYWTYAPSAGYNTHMNFVNVERFALYGGSGTDDLRGGDLGDTLSGGAHDDRLLGYGGAGTYDGGSGTDYVEATVASTAGLHFNLSLAATQTAEQVSNVGTAIETRWKGIEYVRLTTAAGDDALDARLDTTINVRTWDQDGNDFIAGEGNDTFLINYKSHGNHYYEGQGGTDKLYLDWRDATNNISYYSDAYGQKQIVYAPAAGYNSVVHYLSVERFEIYGGSGTDDLRGGALDDTLSGGDASDRLIGSTGTGVYDGGAGVDYVQAAVSTTAGNDFSLSLAASQAAEQLANSGTSIETRWKGVELVDLTTGDGNDTLDVRLDTQTHVRVWDEDGNEFYAGNGNDTLMVNWNTAGTHYFEAGDGTDKVYIDWSAASHNIAYYSDVYGQKQYTYTPFAGYNSEVHYLAVERFEIYGGTGNDDLRGGALDDTLSGGNGSDRLLGGAGTGVYDGGDGVDYVQASVATTAGKNFSLSLAASQSTQKVANSGTDIETRWKGVELVDLTTGGGNDTLDARLDTQIHLRVWDEDGNEFYAGNGNDKFLINWNAAGTHDFQAGDGTDTIVIDWSAASNGIAYYGDAYGQKYYTYTPWSGYNSEVFFSGVERFELYGGSGNDDLRGSSQADTLSGGNGADRLLGYEGKGTYNGGSGEDRVEATIASGSGLDFILNLEAAQTSEQVANSGTSIETRWSGIESVKLILGAGNDTVDARMSTMTNTRTWSDGHRVESGGGNDTFKVNFNARGNHYYDGGDGTDTLVMDYSTTTNSIAFGGHYYYSYDSGGGYNTAIEFYNVERFDLGGGSAGDNLAGAGQDDTLRGNGGDDNLNGWGGNDTAIYSGDASDYIITDLGGDVFTVQDTRANADGTDVVSNVEYLRFDDQTLVLGNDSPTDISLSHSTIVENAANGTVIGGLSSTDPDQGDTATYTLIDSAGGRFAISGNNLVVANSTLLNAESTTPVSIRVRVTDFAGATFDKTFSIAIADVDEFNISAISDAASAANSVAENAAIGTAVGVKAKATDADATTNAITYSLTDTASGWFKIDADGTVRTAKVLNREVDGASQTVTVKAISADGSSTTKNIAIAIADVDEFNISAISDAASAANSVAENAALGTAVGVKAQTTDADATTNAITYSLTNTAGGRFKIDADGTVRTAKILNREVDGASQTVTVKAVSADGSSTTKNIAIAISDVDEFNVGTISDGNSAANSVAENAALGTAVGVKAQTTDADATTNAITYSLTNTASGRFKIDADGTVRTAKVLNREVDGASQTVTVKAISADGSSITKKIAIAIADVDEFNVSAISDGNSAADSILEGSAVNSLVGITAQATDADATNSTITYSLTNDAGGRFAINASGVVRQIKSIDREVDGTSFKITVKATSSDGSSASKNFTIAIANRPGVAINGTGAAELVDAAHSIGSQPKPTGEEDTIKGSGGNDTIAGLGGKDAVDGGGGLDTVLYSEKTASVAVTLNAAALVTVTVGGVAEDRIKNVENVTGGSAADALVGDALANILIGNAGNDTLSGAAGNDTLSGGGGKDKIDGGADIDTADYGDKTAAVTVTLKGATAVAVKIGTANEDTISNVENVSGGSGADKLTGDALANQLTGNAGNDTLSGGSGNDTLVGGLGKDSLTGGANADVFRFDAPLAAANVDLVTDFVAKDDAIQLDNAVMADLGATWTKGMFLSVASGNKATKLDQRVIYDQKTGNLWYDADGNQAGGANPIQIATLTTKPIDVTWQDFQIV